MAKKHEGAAWDHFKEKVTLETIKRNQIILGLFE